MFPSESTIWFGSVTKLPGRAPASLGTNSPPGGSKIVMLTTSPMPSVILHRGRRWAFGAVAPHPAFATALYLALHWCTKRASAASVRAKITAIALAAMKKMTLVRLIGHMFYRPACAHYFRTSCQSCRRVKDVCLENSHRRRQAPSISASCAAKLAVNCT
jgi:hypothetical protein